MAQDDDHDSKKIVRLSDFRRGDLKGEWYGVVQAVLAYDREQGERLLNVGHGGALQADTYLLGDRELYQAGRGIIREGDQIAFQRSEKPEKLNFFDAYRITKLRFI